MQKLPILILLILLAASGCREKDKETDSPQPPPLLNPGLTLTGDDIPRLTEGLPDAVAAGIEARPEYFLELLLAVLDGNRELVRLVNKETGLGPEDVPADLTDLDSYSGSLTLSRKGHRLRQILIPSLLEMTEEASREGITLMISSAYRSYEYQEALFDRYAARDGVEAAERYSARPGKSQHQLGTAIDFGSIDDSFAETEAGRWLDENAWKYGFSLSYPRDMESYTGYVWESWHYRYIGRNASLLEREFFGGIQERMLRYIDEKSGLIEAALIRS